MGNAPSTGYSLVATSQWLLEGTRHYGRRGFEHASRTFVPLTPCPGLTVMVTGANSGLGKQAALDLAALDAEVHLVCRSQARGEEALAELKLKTQRASGLHLHIVDLSSVAEVKAFGERWNALNLPLHALINNAGFIAPAYALTPEGLEGSWATALCQSYLLSGLLLPSLLRAGSSPAGAARSPPSRVINVSSGGGLTVRCDVKGLHTASARAAKFDGTLQYAHSKRAQMLLSELWAARLPAQQVAVVSMHPGWADTPGVRTSLPDFRERNQATLRTEAQGADTAVWLAAAPTLPSWPAANGQLFFDRALAQQHFPMAGTASTPEEKQQLWEGCAEACKWRPE
jgi:dehydrogenase/reductase SDR family protein 12